MGAPRACCKRMPMPAIRTRSGVDRARPARRCPPAGAEGGRHWSRSASPEAVYDGGDDDDGDILVYCLKR